MLLHPTSLPGGVGNGDLGAGAHRFVDFLAQAGFTVWQMLPLGPTHRDDSPYHALSLHAGNPMLISPERLVAWGWLDRHDPSGSETAAAYRLECRAQAHRIFRAARLGRGLSGTRRRSSPPRRTGFTTTRFTARYDGSSPAKPGISGRRRCATVNRRRWRRRRAAGGRDRTGGLRTVRVCAPVAAPRAYAAAHGVLLFGDMPIFVAHDSVDVWTHRDHFALDDAGQPLAVAGVPPDYFSTTGQRWGNPL